MKKGFTLIELIVVIAIIAILAAIIAPNAFKAIEKANRSATLGDYKAIKTATLSFYADTGTWPTDLCEESLLEENTCNASGEPSTSPVSIEGWDGPYLESWPATSRFGGHYAFQNDKSIDWSSADNNGDADDNGSGDSGIEARYLSFSGAGQDSLRRLDQDIDGGTVDTKCDDTGDDCGQHRWENTNNTNYSYILISTDGTVLN